MAEDLLDEEIKEIGDGEVEDTYDNDDEGSDNFNDNDDDDDIDDDIDEDFDIDDEDFDIDEEDPDLFNLDDEFDTEDDEEDGEKDGKEDDEEDDDLYENLSLTEGFQKLVKGANAKGEKVDKSFVIDAMEKNVSMKYLIENNIYNLGNMIDRIEKYQHLNGEDPEVVVYPDETDPEGRAKFDEEHRNVPLTADEYEDELFEGIDVGSGPLSEDTQMVEKFRNYYHQQGFSREQARSDLESRQEEVEEFLEGAKLEMAEYKQENASVLKDALGDDYAKAMSRIKAVIKKHGKEFAEEFKGTKVLSSARLFLMLERMMQERYIIPEAEEVIDQKPDFTKLSNNQIAALKKKIMANPAYADEKEYGTPAEKKRWKALDEKLEALVAEDVRRRS